MLCYLSFLSHLQCTARFSLFDFLGLFASESFVFILQSGSAVLSTKDHRTDDCLTRPELCLCRPVKDAPSTDDLCDVQEACLTHLTVRFSHRSWHTEIRMIYRIRDNGTGMMFSILIKDFCQVIIIQLGWLLWWKNIIIFERDNVVVIM